MTATTSIPPAYVPGITPINKADPAYKLWLLDGAFGTPPERTWARTAALSDLIGLGPGMDAGRAA